MAAPRILLVEDDPDQRGALSGILRGEGYMIVEAAGAEQALALLDRTPVDLIVTDYRLQGASGAWLAQMAGRSAPVPPRILLITAQDDVVEAQVLHVLRKPLDIKRFVAEVAAALADRPEPAVAARPPHQRIEFLLYVNGSRASRRLIKRMRDLLAPYDESEVTLAIIDLSRATEHQAEEHRILATPTLLKTFPAPRVWITGESPHPALIASLLEHAGVEVRK